MKAGYLWEGSFHDTDQGSPQGGVLAPLLANVYLHPLDQAQRTEKSFLGRLVRYADDFVVQCGTRSQAERAYAWFRTQVERLGLRLHPEKTRVVEDQEGFDFLGFHHRRVRLRGQPQPGWRLLRWPSRKACTRFRTHIRQLVGPPQRLREQWGEQMQALRRYLTGWCQYYRHGASYETFVALDHYVLERLARNRARAQPVGRGRRRRHWQHYREIRRGWEPLPRLTQLRQAGFRAYGGEVKVRWRAV